MSNPKFHIYTLILFLAGFSTVQGQTVISQEITASASSTIRSLYPDITLSDIPDTYAAAWTVSTDTCIHRTFIRFDLSAVDPSLQYDSITLDLFGNPSTTRPANQGFNQLEAVRITSSWSDTEVNWLNQPDTDVADGVVLPQSSSAVQDYLHIDVKDLVTEQFSEDASDFSLLLKLADERIFRYLTFASSNHPDPALRPKITFWRSEEIISTGIEALAEKAITVAPTLFSASVTINFDFVTNQEVHAELYDLSGKRLYATMIPAGSSTFRLQPAVRVDGLCLLRLRTEKWVHTQRLVGQ